VLTFKNISFLYLKYITIIVFALVLFFVGFDFMGHIDSLPESANLKLLYVLFRSYYALDVLFPISLVFALIVTKITMIRSNSLVAYYSLGYSKLDVLKPFILISTILITAFVGLHMYQPFAKANEYSKNISKNKNSGAPTEHLFFTYEDYFVYFKELHPLQQSAKEIRIFKVKDKDLREITIAKEAKYIKNYWVLKDAKTIIKPENININSEGIKVVHNGDIKLLKNFRPKILDQVYEGASTYSILDAFEAIKILKEQNLNTDKVRSVLYKTIVYPYFVPFLVIIIFFFVPISPRFFNVSLFSFAALIVTLVVWGLFFTLIQLSNAKTVSGEIGIVLPVVILAISSIVVWFKKGHT